MGSEIWNFKLKEIELEKWIIFVPNNFKIRKNWLSYAHAKSVRKSGSWTIFGPLLGFLATILDIWTCFLFRPSFRSILMGKPIFRTNGNFKPQKNLRKTNKMAYIMSNDIHYVKWHTLCQIHKSVAKYPKCMIQDYT